MPRILYITTTAFYIQLCSHFVFGFCYLVDETINMLRKLCNNQRDFCAIPKSPLFTNCIWMNPLVFPKADGIAVLKLSAKPAQRHNLSQGYLEVPRECQFTVIDNDSWLWASHYGQNIFHGRGQLNFWCYLMHTPKKEVFCKETPWSHCRILKDTLNGYMDTLNGYMDTVKSSRQKKIGNVFPLKEVEYNLWNQVTSNRGLTQNSNTSKPNKRGKAKAKRWCSIERQVY